jgi:hypothetical protein
LEPLPQKKLQPHKDNYRCYFLQPFLPLLPAPKVAILRDKVLRNSHVLFTEANQASANSGKILTQRTSFINAKTSFIVYSPSGGRGHLGFPNSPPTHLDKRCIADKFAARSYSKAQSETILKAGWYILDTNGNIQIWDGVILLFVVYNSIALPYEVAFLTTDSIPSTMTYLNGIADYCFALDLFLSFFKSYENDRGEMIADVRLIRRQYFKFWFWIDFPACVPLDVFFPDLKAVGALKCIRLLRMGRIIKLMEQLESANQWNILRLILGFALLAHWFGCVWATSVDKWDDTFDERGTVFQGNTTALLMGDSEMNDANQEEFWWENHLRSSTDVNTTNFYRWLVAFYHALCMLLGENTEPVQVAEYVVHILVLLVGAILQAYIFGQVALLISDQNSTSMKWKQKMDNVGGLMRALELPKGLQRRIRNYYEYYWNRHKVCHILLILIIVPVHHWNQ